MPLNLIPQAGQTLGQTRQPILDNFNIISAAFVVDHVDYQNANQGKHNRVTMPAQANGPATMANEMAIYTKLVTGAPQLFLRRQNQIPLGADVDITSFQHNFVNPTTISGFARFPGGVLVKWGVLNAPAGGLNINIPFPAGTIPPFTTAPLVDIARMGQVATAGGITLAGVTTTTIDVYNNGGAGSFTYIAIGLG